MINNPATPKTSLYHRDQVLLYEKALLGAVRAIAGGCAVVCRCGHYTIGGLQQRRGVNTDAVSEWCQLIWRDYSSRPRFLDTCQVLQ